MTDQPGCCGSTTSTSADTHPASPTDVTAEVRHRYAQAAVAVGQGAANTELNTALQDGTTMPSLLVAEGDSGCCGGDASVVEQSFGAGLYAGDDTSSLPAEALAASLGCGNPTAVASLVEGERVLDLGSGGGIDVLLSARRVGPTGFAWGVDMTDEMLALARENAAKTGATNVEFLRGRIEDVPLPDASVDVVISNCVINLSVDKARVMHEMYRVLVPGGRIGVSDVVAEDHLSPTDRAERGSYVACIAGALSRAEYVDLLSAAGFVDVEVEFTHETAPQMHGAIVRALKPLTA
ncbi:arsenite methyltransferase [Nocardioides yefusunii]|uniref:Arsenite methyltransferase n=1 Tax=Nocardioides yefusunii TaxID=2500546 RepID=A0ABW1QU43_9ACTN|nr:arsenite methyltransferase [Nocardioides yefusunii]